MKIPENLRSSKNADKLSRTLVGLIGSTTFLLASFTPYTEAEWVAVTNALLLTASALYALFGLLAKIYNRVHKTKI